MTRATRAPERVAWFAGAPLRRRDLQDAVAHEERMLALHVGAMHGTWGAALGLSVVVGADRRAVIVTPGLAYTCRGRSLVLGDALQLDAPRAMPGVAGAAAFDLVAFAPPSPEGAPCERLTGCGVPAAIAMLAVRWEGAGAVAAGGVAPPLATGIRLGDEVPLARVVRNADGTLGDPDYGQRRIARGVGRPHVARGLAPEGALAWRDEGQRLVATVDTSDGGFTTVPRYFVSLVAAPRWPAASVLTLLAVTAARERSFDVEVRAATRVPGLTRTQRLEGVPPVSLAWVGVEMARGCPPALRAGRIGSLAGGLVDLAPWRSLLVSLGLIGP